MNQSSCPSRTPALHSFSFLGSAEASSSSASVSSWDEDTGTTLLSLDSCTSSPSFFSTAHLVSIVKLLWLVMALMKLGNLRNRFRRRSQIDANEASVQAKDAFEILQPDADKKLSESGHLTDLLDPATKSNALAKSSESAHFSVSTNDHATVVEENIHKVIEAVSLPSEESNVFSENNESDFIEYFDEGHVDLPDAEVATATSIDTWNQGEQLTSNDRSSSFNDDEVKEPICIYRGKAEVKESIESTRDNNDHTGNAPTSRDVAGEKRNDIASNSSNEDIRVTGDVSDDDLSIAEDDDVMDGNEEEVEVNVEKKIIVEQESAAFGLDIDFSMESDSTDLDSEAQQLPSNILSNDGDEGSTCSKVSMDHVPTTTSLEHHYELHNITASFDDFFGADNTDDEKVEEHLKTGHRDIGSACLSLDDVLDYEHYNDDETPTDSFDHYQYSAQKSDGVVKRALSTADQSLDDVLDFEEDEDGGSPTDSFDQYHQYNAKQCDNDAPLDNFDDEAELDQDDDNEEGDLEVRHSRPPPVVASSSSISTTSTVSYSQQTGRTGRRNSIQFEMIPDNIGQPFNTPPTTGYNTWNRLYNEGIEKEKKKALKMKRYNDDWNSSKKLNLATRGRRGSVSAPRSRMDTSEPPAYSRLYALAKQGETFKQKSLRISSTKALPPSSSRADKPRRGHTPGRGHTPAYERLYNLSKSKKETHEEKKKAISTKEKKRTRSRIRSIGVLSTQERLYNLAKKKRLIEDERMKLRKKILEEKEKPKVLYLEARSYTPVRDRSRGEHENVHNRLYSLAKVKNSAQQQQHNMSKEEKPRYLDPKKVKSTAGVNRLYSLSLKKQQQGQERRQMIEMKKLKPVCPSRKISLKKATGMYDRGMKQKINLEVKREDEGMDPYVSPLLNPLLAEEDNDEDSQILRYRPSSAVSGVRSQSKARPGQPSGAQSRTSVGSAPNKTKTATPRIRARSRLRTATPTMFSFRSPSATPAYRASTSTSRLRGRSTTPQKEERFATPQKGGRFATPQKEGRFGTPQRAVKRNSTKDLLRKMEDDVGFYKKVKQALAQKERDESGGFDPKSAQYGQRCKVDLSRHSSPSLPPQIPPTGKLYVSMTPDSPRGMTSDNSNGTLRTGSSMTQCSNERETSPVGRFLVRPRSHDYCD